MGIICELFREKNGLKAFVCLDHLVDAVVICFCFFPPKPREEGKKNMAATPATPKTEEDGPPPPTNKHPLIPPEGQGARSVQRIKTNIATPIKRRQSKHASVVNPAA